MPDVQEASDRFSGLGLFENEIGIAVCRGRVTMRLVLVGPPMNMVSAVGLLLMFDPIHWSPG